MCLPGESIRVAVAASVACITTSSLAAQTAREALGAAAIESLADEPPAKIIIDPPLADPLSHGREVIQYRALQLHIAPVFGAEVLAVSPRVGHLHVILTSPSVVSYSRDLVTSLYEDREGNVWAGLRPALGPGQPRTPAIIP